MKTFHLNLLLIVIAITVSCNNEEIKNQELILTNTSDIELFDKPISIERKVLNIADTTSLFPIVIFEQDTIPSQVNTSRNSSAWDELFFVIDFKPKEVKTISVAWVTEKPTYKARTSARFGKRASAETKVAPQTKETMLANELPLSLGYQQYQTDGPSWENDKVGFRHYLDGRNAKDLFGKKTSAISPENVGINANGAVEDNYHVMEDWGRDILAVGNSVGLGGYALATENELMRLGVTVNDSINTIEKTTFEIRNEGPINSVLEYTFSNWKPNERTYNVSETTSIWPGTYGYKNTVSVEGLQGDENLVVGLVNINNDQPLEVFENNDKYVVLLTHDKQSYEKEWWLGMALILPKEKYKGYIEAPKTGNLSNTYLAKLDIKNYEPISYFAIAGWELSNEDFIDRSKFVSYVKNLADQLSAEITIK
ncbi:DUF4861 domain-containing protein [Maribacter sp. CXY002]|uniref:DUF4861 domain-containing protein n=1 Tax=Maribacter luteocoastalis TaxID=3407671 RepID=UPI003B67C27A